MRWSANRGHSTALGGTQATTKRSIRSRPVWPKGVEHPMKSPGRHSTPTAGSDSSPTLTKWQEMLSATFQA